MVNMENQPFFEKKVIMAVIAGIALFCIGIFLFFLYPKKGFVDYPKVSDGTIIAFGDSLTEGIGAPNGNDYVSLISKRISVPVINAGRSGDTTIDGLARLEKDVLSKNPRVVIVFLGGNDGLRRFPPEEVFTRLGIIVDRIHEKNAGVLLVGIRPAIFSREYNKKFARLAKEKKTSFVPDILDGIVGKSSFMFDAIHPNEKGYEIVASRIEPELRKMLSPPGK